MSRQQRRGAIARREALAPRLRWTPARKLQVCMALRGRVVTADEVKAAHGLSDAELAEWQADHLWLLGACVS